MVTADLRSGTAMRQAIGWITALCIGATLLNLFAVSQARRGLDRQAVERIERLRAGGTIEEWALDDAKQVVAGRLFGDATWHFDDDGLLATGNGGAFEFGIPLAHPLDLARTDWLRIDASGDAAFRYRLSTTAPDGFRCHSPQQAAHDGAVTFELNDLTWTCPDGSPHRFATVAMLRLVVDGPRRAPLRLSKLALLADARSLPSRGDIPTLADASRLVATAEWIESLPTTQIPMAVVAPSHWQASELAQRQALRQQAPTTIVVSSTDVLNRNPDQTTFQACDATAILVIVLALVCWPIQSPRRRAMADLVVITSVPLWLSAGGRLGSPFLPMDQILLGTWGLAVLWRWPRSRSPQWHWFGDGKGWWLPLLSVAIAATLGLMAPASITATFPGAATIATYLAWATIQQGMMLAGIADRLHDTGLPTHGVTVVTALLFALLHTPNQSLMLLTLTGSLLWTASWQRHRALLPIVIAHAACALIVTTMLPPDWLWSAEVGSRFALE